MKSIDFVCEGEVTPRVELLLEHLEMLGAPVKLHRSLPKDPSKPVVLMPAAQDSALARFSAKGLWCVAIYLDKQTRQIPATHQFAIPSWPARSCDPLMRELASYLKRPDVSEFPTTPDLPTTTPGGDHAILTKRGLFQNRQPTNYKQLEQRALVGFGVVSLIFFAWLVSSVSTQDEAPNEVTGEVVDADQTIVDTDTSQLPSIEESEIDVNFSISVDEETLTASPPTLEESSQQATTQAQYTEGTIDTRTAVNTDVFAQTFAQQALEHPHYCSINPQPQAELQAADANTKATKPAYN